MRILFLATQDIESPGGAGRWLPIARELSKLGHTVTIAALHPDFDQCPDRAYMTDGVEINYIAQMHVRKEGDSKTYFSSKALLMISTRAMIAFIIKVLTSKMDIVVVAKPHPMNSVAGLLAKIILKKKLIVDCDDYEAESNTFSHAWQKHLVGYFERKTPGYADATLTNTRFMVSKLVEWGIPKNKIIYLPNGVDVDRFNRHTSSTSELSQLKEKLGVQGKKIIAYIGSLSLTSHPLGLLIQAIAILSKEDPHIVCLIVGGGGDYNRLVKMTADLGQDKLFVFCGRIPPNQIAAYYHIANISVDPVSDDVVARSRCPIKLFESWAAGTPFVSADVGDRRYLLGEPPAGVLAAPADPKSLAEAIYKVLQDDTYAKMLSQWGLIRAQSFAWSVLVHQLEQYLRKILT